MISFKSLLTVYLLGSVFAYGQAQPKYPVFVHSTSPNGKYLLTLSAGELNIQHVDENDQQILHPGDGYASDNGELGSIVWSADSQFLLITHQAGAHDQYTEQILYQCDETGFGKFKAWSFHEVTLLNRIGAFALADPDLWA
jgi:WD40 repeat protein